MCVDKVISVMPRGIHPFTPCRIFPYTTVILEGANTDG